VQGRPRLFPHLKGCDEEGSLGEVLISQWCVGGPDRDRLSVLSRRLRCERLRLKDGIVSGKANRRTAHWRISTMLRIEPEQAELLPSRASQPESVNLDTLGDGCLEFRFTASDWLQMAWHQLC
jgi:hypothetical protein